MFMEIRDIYRFCGVKHQTYDDLHPYPQVSWNLTFQSFSIDYGTQTKSMLETMFVFILHLWDQES